MAETLGAVLRRAAALGFIAGLRSVAAPALLSSNLARQPGALAGTPLRLLATPTVAVLLRLSAVGEMGLDKLPILPPRIAPPALAGRILSGAVTGAVAGAAARRSPLLGALVGGGMAFLGAHAGYRFRMDTAERLQVPSEISGLFEDAFVAGVGRRIVGL